MKNLDYGRARFIINKELQKDIANIEIMLKRFIKLWFKRNSDFYLEGFKIDSESESDGDFDGFYNLKIWRSFWNNDFPFECKNLGNVSSLTLSKSLREYTFNSSKKDGGMYRYFIKKYSSEQDFGGMMGFVLSNSQTIKNSLIKKIKEIYDKEGNGQLVEKKIIDNPIPNNDFVFMSIHNRNSEIFYMYHTLFYFELIYE